jgi:hypothetical protein
LGNKHWKDEGMKKYKEGGKVAVGSRQKSEKPSFGTTAISKYKP